ncbi:6-phosphogluconolactonase [Candidatus Profftia lariciata]|uniref:6-phosphogluconolactonase n=1 Tax=Candidatus Profftia lariciata TaxID=1987921 RepID=UPI001D031341|nr:6-phosphogluconolactonase [Candidatus Profftia lariciata]UDG81315.1 6-phosphogluconolactonase [Candidatus Profftia lariciata]
MVFFKNFPNTQVMNEYCVEKIAIALTYSINTKGQASLIVSGGKTPLRLFKALTQKDIAWSKVVITLADERWVDTTDNCSNEYLVRKYLLKDYAVNAMFISLKNNYATPFAGAIHIEHQLKIIKRPFDVVILGMGEDGHTASLFPKADNLDQALAMDSGRVCMGIKPLTANLDRITLTLPTLLNSYCIYLYIIGNKKYDVYQRAIQGSNIYEMPIRAILNQVQTPVNVCYTR